MMREGSKADPFLPKIEESLLWREGGGEVRGEAKAEGLPEAAETGFKWSKLAVEEDLEMALAVWMRRTCEGMRLREKEKKRKDTDLDHDGQNGSQEGTEEEAVCGENQSGESTDLFETADV